jgi:hypothetical protein
MKSLGTPFSNICVEEVASSPLITSHQIVLNLIFFITSIKKVHEMEQEVRLFLLMKEASGLLYEHEIVLNEAPLDESG